MNTLDVLLRQTRDAHLWTNKLITSLPEKLWNETPGILASSMAWQVGHLVVSEYYHAILVISGFSAEITERIDLKAYNRSYGYGSIPKDVARTANSGELKEDLAFMQAQVLQHIAALKMEDLASNVEQPIAQKHPVATTKFDAVSWNIKHTMWHCGQMATIKRVVHESYDYGLPKPT